MDIFTREKLEEIADSLSRIADSLEDKEDEEITEITEKIGFSQQNK